MEFSPGHAHKHLNSDSGMTSGGPRTTAYGPCQVYEVDEVIELRHLHFPAALPD